MNRSPRGMTLIELLVTVAVLGVLTTVILNVLGEFQKISTSAYWRREAGQNARAAMTSMERDLRLAGYGMEPSMAFDFNVYKGQGNFCSPTGGTATDCAPLRDSTTGSDELVFYARSPEYFPNPDDPAHPEGRAWIVKSTSTSAQLVLDVRVAGTNGPYFGKGQILQIVCPFAAASTYVEVATTTSITATGLANIPLINSPNAGNPYRQSQLIGGANTPCLASGSARAYMIDRFRYFVATPTLKDNQTIPYLVLDRGIDVNGDGAVDAKDFVPIAEGIEDLQVAYVVPTALGTAPKTVGATVGVGTAFCDATAVSPGSCTNGLRVLNFASLGAGSYSTWSYLQFPIASPMRNSSDAGNILAVHLTLVARGLTAQNNRRLEQIPAALNRDVSGTAARFVRTEWRSVVETPNLRSRGLSYL